MKSSSRIRLCALMILLFLCHPISQARVNTPQDPKDKLPSFSEFLQQKQSPAEQLSKCPEDLQKWKDWAAKNIPIHENLLKEYSRISERNSKLEEERSGYRFLIIAAFGFSIGTGIYTIVLLKRLVKKIHIRIPAFSQPRKKLITLLSAAAWVTLAVLANGDEASRHPSNALAAAAFWSLPALALAGILVWWFSRSQSPTAP